MSAGANTPALGGVHRGCLHATLSRHHLSYAGASAVTHGAALEGVRTHKHLAVEGTKWLGGSWRLEAVMVWVSEGARRAGSKGVNKRSNSPWWAHGKML